MTFSASIQTVDRGSKDILVQKVKGTENILLLKAGRRNFQQTNLTVITTDGMLYSFLVNYAGNPQQLQWQVERGTTSAQTVRFSDNHPLDEMKRTAESLLVSPGRFPFDTHRKHKMKLSLRGIYVNGDIMFYHLQVSNFSNVDFDAESLRFFVKDKQRSRRTASQEIDLKPIFQLNDLDKGIVGNTVGEIVVALPKCTIPDAKRLRIELMEKSGGRHLRLSLRNRTLINAKQVPVS